MKRDKIHGHILSARIIPNVNASVAAKLKLRPDQKSLLIYSGDADDVAYIASDYATKMANVEVVYGESLYAGAANANTRLAGEVIIVMAGPTPEEVIRAYGYVKAVHDGDTVCFISANDTDDIIYLAVPVARTGSYLSALYGIPKGAPLAYCVAPPTESIFAMDAAAKAANVTLLSFIEPPSNTNFAGAMYTGTQAACAAACRVFAEAVESVADQPVFI